MKITLKFTCFLLLFQHSILTLQAQQLPNLISASTTATPSTRMPGETISIATKILNMVAGTTTTDFELNYFLSRDTLYDATDSLLGSVPVKGFTTLPIASIPAKVFKIPISTQAGKFFILAYPDKNNIVKEEKENDNVHYFGITIINLPDFVPTVSPITPATVYAGDSIAFAASLSNTGGNSKNSFVDVRFFISTDRKYGIDDAPLSPLLTVDPPTNAKATNFAKKNYLIPSIWPAGVSYILMVCDGRFAETEMNENNNESAVQISVETRPDYLVKNTIGSGTIYPGTKITIASIILNTGSSNTGTESKIQYYFSNDEKVDVNDIQIKSLPVPDLKGSETYTIPSFTYELSRKITPGSYYILSLIDSIGLVKEALESNNTTPLKIIVGSTDLADLVINNFEISSPSVIAGDPVGLGCSVKNQGKATAATNYLRYYLSKNATYDAEDTPLSDPIEIKAMPKNTETKVALNNFSIPLSTQAGTYRILIFVDHEDVVTETIDDNNVEAIFIKVAARSELIIKDAVLKNSSIYEGDSSTISVKVLNNGLGSSAAFVSLQIFLSKDTIYQFTDVTLTNIIPVKPIPGGGSLDFTEKKFKIPAGTPAGSYYVLSWIDNYNVVKEVDDSNNIMHVPITILDFPDLVVSSTVASPKEIIMGDSVTIKTFVKNIGKGATPNEYSLQYFLSKDQRLDSKDKVISGLFSMPALGAGGVSAEALFRYKMPDTVKAGFRYILVFADEAGQVREGNEDNNILAAEIKVGDPDAPNLVVSYFYIDTVTLVAGDHIGLKATVENIGRKDIYTNYKFQYFLSIDEVFDNSDIPVSDEIIMDSLKVGTKDSIQYKRIQIPLKTKPGEYRLLAVADIGNLIDESAESNNWLDYPIIITPFPDFTISQAISYPVTLYIGDKTTLKLNIKNAGGSASLKPVTLQYFLSDDPVYSTNDKSLSKEIMVEKLKMSAIKIMPDIKLTIPQDILGGIWYIIPIVDTKQQVIEISEENNTSPLSMLIKPRPVVVLPDSIDSTKNVIRLDVKVRSEIPVAAVEFMYRKISDSTVNVVDTLPLGNAFYTANIPKTFKDVIGVEYFFLATDSGGNKSLLSQGAIQAEYGLPGLEIPYTSFGKTERNYRIIATPLILRNPRIDSVFTKLLKRSSKKYDKKIWRIHNYKNLASGNSYYEFENGIDSLDPGKGYWFVAKDDEGFPIYTGAGSAVETSVAEPFNIPIKKGWNQVGNPYNMRMYISDINNFGRNKFSGVPQWEKFIDNWITADNDSNTLKPLEGSFLFARDTMTLYFPTQIRKPKIAGNKRLGDNEKLLMTENNWDIPLQVEGENTKYTIAGLGMNELANVTADNFDNFTPPSLTNFVEINFRHPEYFYSKFTKDIVPSCSENIWEMEVLSSEKGNKTISWDNKFFAINSKKLMLYDNEVEKVVDMGKHTSYSFSGMNKKLKVFYGNSEFIENSLQPDRVTLGNPTPNPITENTTLSVSLPACKENYLLQLQVFNSHGKKVSTIANDTYSQGFYEFSWNGLDAYGVKLPVGIYIVKLEVTKDGLPIVLTRKVMAD